MFMKGNRKKLSMTHPEYSRVKKNLDHYLHEKVVFETMEGCVFSILKRRETTQFSPCQLANLRMKQLRILMSNMKIHFCNENPYLVNQAVLFEFRERAMMNPFSLIGSRVFHLLFETWKNTVD
jgi:hypothetical protein